MRKNISALIVFIMVLSFGTISLAASPAMGTVFYEADAQIGGHVFPFPIAADGAVRVRDLTNLFGIADPSGAYLDWDGESGTATFLRGPYAAWFDTRTGRVDLLRQYCGEGAALATHTSACFIREDRVTIPYSALLKILPQMGFNWSEGVGHVGSVTYVGLTLFLIPAGGD